jgi:hypothetical protein
MQKCVLDMFLTLRSSAEEAGVSAYVTDNENEATQSYTMKLNIWRGGRR